VPLTIISAGNATPAQIEEWDRLAAASPGGHIRARTAGHWVHLDEPGLVLTAIRQTLEHVSAL
jgi:pimeloyl-ACP methyl ester carboxylesterase